MGIDNVENLTLDILGGKTTFAEAREEEDDMLVKLSYPQKRLALYNYIFSHRCEIAEIVSHHLNVRTSADCQISHHEDWIHGSFNLCLPLCIKNWTKQGDKKMIIRFPLPYRMGEAMYPGNADEKLRCEAATYI